MAKMTKKNESSKRQPKSQTSDKMDLGCTPIKLEDDDYYLNEDGLMVFTRSYHLKRGYCCGSKCKHCPYGLAQETQEEK